MKFLTLSVFSALFIAVVLAAETDPPTEKTTHTNHTSTHSSSSSTEPSTTPSTVPTTSSTTVSTTTHETTTTTTTSSTSTEPTTTPKSSTTTPKSSTTTPSPSTTTVKPTPEPKPSDVPKIFWNVTENENFTCIRAVMKLYFELSVDNETKYIVVDNNASDSKSSCISPDGEEKLVLDVPNYYTFTMVFVNESNQVYVNETTLEYYSSGKVKVEGTSHDKLFTVSVGHSYLCNSQADVKLGSDVIMHLEEVHIQAFGTPKELFGDAQECDKDDKVSDAIPIAVGVALAALIIIVLIAYLVGRRQSRQRGYQSV